MAQIGVWIIQPWSGVVPVEVGFWGHMSVYYIAFYLHLKLNILRKNLTETQSGKQAMQLFLGGKL